MKERNVLPRHVKLCQNCFWREYDKASQKSFISKSYINKEKEVKRGGNQEKMMLKK